MAVHKLHLEEFDEVDYNLIAIYSSLEDYKLAFKLNQSLSILLSKNENEIPIEIQEKVAHFSRFTFEDENEMMVWDLIQNKQMVELPVKSTAANLFENKNINRRVALVSELKKVDYFLKIEYNAHCKIKEIVDKINKIDSISAVHEINTDKMKSKNNLIF
jgi:Mg2+/Co2+ transporter CorC